MNQIAKSEKGINDLDAYVLKQDSLYPPDAYRMKFITNHDENSWNGTEFDRYEDAHQVYAVLAFTFGGMPLLYSGQESGNSKSLRFFEKDTIDWKDYPYQEFYTKLLKLHQSNPALWNGANGGSFKRLKVDSPFIYAYSRKKDDHEVIVVLNFAQSKQQIRFDEAIEGELKSIFNEQVLSVFSAGDMSLGPNGFQVFAR
jgi:1,4-alpha-glucan branching enzyme